MQHSNTGTASRGRAWRRGAAIVMAVLLLGSMAAAGAQGPALLYEMDLQAAGHKFSDGDMCFWTTTDRGYYALYVTMTPDNPAQGSLLQAWDVGCDRKTILAEDLNAICGAAPEPGKTGWRFRCVVTEDERDRGKRLLFGVNGPGGGRLVRYDLHKHALEALGRVPDGGEIVSLSRHGYKPFVALVRKPATNEFRLYTVDGEGAFGTVIAAGGTNLASFFHSENNRVYYQDDAGKLMEAAPGKPEAPRPVEAAGALRLLTGGGLRDLADGTQVVAPRYYNQSRHHYWFRPETGELTGTECMRGMFPFHKVVLEPTPALKGFDGPIAQITCLQSLLGPVESLPAARDLVKTVPWHLGMILRTGAGQDGRQHLMAFTPADGRVADLGPLTNGAGAAITRVAALTTDGGGHVAALTESGGRLAAQLYRCPFLDELVTLINRAFDTYAGTNKTAAVKVEVIDSFHAYGVEQDRGWDPLLCASDGKLYFGAMPHHPNRSTRVWQYRPGEDRMRDLGSFDALAGITGTNLVPSMMHIFPVEMDGWVYFTGEDPFYGKRGFPGLRADAAYPGSPILACKLGTLEFVSRGIPRPGRSIFGLLPGFGKGILYLHENYEDAVWQAFDVKTGSVKPLALPSLHKMQHIDSQGLFYFVDPLSGDVRRFNPDLNAAETIGRLAPTNFPDVTWVSERPNLEAWWLLETLGKDKAIGLVDACEAVVELDTKTGVIRCIGRLRPEIRQYPRANRIEGFRAFGLANGLFVGIRNIFTSAPRHCELYTLDLQSGKAEYHGIMRDSRERMLKESNCMAVGKDGTVYIQASVYNRSGDAFFSHRGAWSSGDYQDTILGRLRLSAK